MMSCRVVCVSERVKEAFQDVHMTVLIKVARRPTLLASLPDQLHTRQQSGTTEEIQPRLRSYHSSLFGPTQLL